MPFLTFLKFILTQFCLFSLLTFCQNEKLRASETVEMAVLEAQKWLKLISRKNWVEEKFLNFYTLSKIEFRYDKLYNMFFSATQILREIIFGYWRMWKIAILTISETGSKVVKMAVFCNLHSSKLVSRKIWLAQVHSMYCSWKHCISS